MSGTPPVQGGPSPSTSPAALLAQQVALKAKRKRLHLPPPPGQMPSPTAPTTTANASAPSTSTTASSALLTQSVPSDQQTPGSTFDVRV
jgi:hypothetical protein